MSFTLSALQAARTERRHGFAWAVAASILLVLGLVALSLRKGARVKRALEAQERRMAKNG